MPTNSEIAEQLSEQGTTLGELATSFAVLQRDVNSCLKVIEGNGNGRIDTRVTVLERDDKRASKWAWRFSGLALAIGTGWLLNILTTWKG